MNVILRTVEQEGIQESITHFGVEDVYNEMKECGYVYDYDEFENYLDLEKNRSPHGDLSKHL